MGCGISSKHGIRKTLVDVSSASNIKNSPEQFVTSNEKKFTDVYKVGICLGSGAYGEVKRVVHKITGQERAVKVFLKDFNHFSSYKTVKNEIEILRRLNHPIIIKMYEFFEDEKRVYMVLEKCDGGELFEQISKNKRLNENIAALICKQLFSALSYLHDNNIAHRDMKPENILLEDREDFINIKIIDFGTAVTIQKNNKSKGRNNNWMLTDVVGSAYYIAPEVIIGNYDEKCDLWSSGVILYILLSGVPPFAGNTNEQIMHKIRIGKFSFADAC